jgi:hypothetical protein
MSLNRHISEGSGNSRETNQDPDCEFLRPYRTRQGIC